MKKKEMKFWLGFVVSAVLFLFGGVTGSAMADAITVDNGEGTVTAQEMEGAGLSINGPGSVTVGKGLDDKTKANLYLDKVNKAVCKMVMTSTPIDQILRNAKNDVTDSIVVKDWSIGQRALKITLTKEIALDANDKAHTLTDLTDDIFKEGDTIEVYKADGTPVYGWEESGARSTIHPLMLRVVGKATDDSPVVIAMNGNGTTKKVGFYDATTLTKLEIGWKLLRLGPAAAELEVQAGTYYNYPTPEKQYCQRYLMQVEDSIIERLSHKEIDWNFTDVEQASIEEMRIGMEGSGLFGVKSMRLYDGKGNIYTQEGIWYRAGKDVTLGTWTDTGKTESAGKKIYQLVITEDELVDFVSKVIDGAGNGSRTKILFVDNKLYSALAKIKTNKQRMLQTEANFKNWGLDFESFTSMGTKLLVYRHDLFNEYGMSYKGFVLDPQYLRKNVFQAWQRHEYNLKDLFIRNSNAVTIEEFSCWTLQFPNAHARVGVATVPTDGVAA